MTHISPQLLMLFETLVFASVVLLHLTKKNRLAIWLYVVQSAAITMLLVSSSVEKASFLLIMSLIATVAVKLIVAPAFFFRLIKQNQAKFSASTYLNVPTTLFAIIAIVLAVEAIFSNSILYFGAVKHNLLLIAASSIFVSIFLLINRKGVLSQMLGVLSLENSIVSFSILAGLEQSPSLQLGIIFDIFIWIVIATIFASMIYKHFGTLDVSEMKGLTE